MRRPAWMVAGACVVLLGGGCGGEAGGSAQDDVRQVTEAFVGAATAEDAGRMCRQFNREVARVTFDAPCDKLSAPPQTFFKTYYGNARVVATRVDGDRAQVTVRNDAVGETGLDLRKGTDGWRITELSEGSRAAEQDAKAQVAMNRALIALGRYLDSHASFAGADARALRRLAPGLPPSLRSEPARRTVSLQVDSESGNTFRQVARLIGGTIDLTGATCDVAGAGGCPPDGTWE